MRCKEMSTVVEIVSSHTWRLGRVYTCMRQSFQNDSHRKKIERDKESILAMKGRTKILRDTIVQRDVELTVLPVVCTESMVKLSSIEKRLDYLMGKQKKHTIEFQSSPLQEYIDKACSSLSPHLHNGRWFLQVGQDQEIGQHYMSIPFEIRREKCQLGRIIPCDGAYGQGAFGGSDEIKGWFPIEWGFLGSHSQPGVQSHNSLGIFGMKDAQVCIGIQVGDLMRDG